MTATTPHRYGKRAFVIFLMLSVVVGAQTTDDAWRLTIVPAFQRPPLHKPIRGSKTAVLVAAREAGYGALEFAKENEAFQRARASAEKFGDDWVASAKMEIHRDKNHVIESIIITDENGPFLPSLALAPAFYEHFEPLLGAGFYVAIPDRSTLALFPRLAGGIPAEATVQLIEKNRLATYPVSREVFRAHRGGLTAVGILEE